jgi:hypothetical protein
MLSWAVAALAVETPNPRLSDDIALTKATISSLAAKDFAAVRDQLDPKLPKLSDDTLRQMSDLMGPGKPLSVETVWSTETHNPQNEDGISRVLLEYALAGKWVVADAAVKTEGASKRFVRLYLFPNALPLKELNEFHLYGKGPLQYLFLAAWIAAIVLTGLAIIAAFRRHSGWRRWLFIVAMPFGLTPTVALNWNTAQMWVIEAVGNPAGHIIPVVAARYPMALFSYTEMGTPYLCISAPLFALGYLIWHRLQGRQQPSSRLDEVF